MRSGLPRVLLPGRSFSGGGRNNFGCLLDLSAEIAGSPAGLPHQRLSWILFRWLPTDPLIYRFYEIHWQVYGLPSKIVIQEEIRDASWSAIDFTLNLEKNHDPGGARVQVSMCGKFLALQEVVIAAVDQTRFFSPRKKPSQRLGFGHFTKE